MGERDFTSLVRRMVKAGQYLANAKLTSTMERSFHQSRSELTDEQGRSRREEIEAAGCDWEASKKARGLVNRDR